MNLWKTLAITLLMSLMLVSCTWGSGNSAQPEEAAPSHSEEVLPEEQTEEHAETSLEEETSTGAQEGETPAESAQGQAPAENAQGETFTEGAEGEAPAESAEGEAPAESAEGEAPAEGAEGEAPAEGAEGEAPVESAEGEAPAEGAQGAEGEAPVEGAEGETPVESAEGEAPAEGAEGEAPAEGAEGEAPTESAEGEAPAEGAEGEAPAESAEGEAPAESAEGEAPAESAEGEAPAESAEGEAPAEGAEGEASAEGAEGEAPAEGAEGEASAESAEGEAPAEGAEGEVTAEGAMEPAIIINDEGGPASITGMVEYTNAFFTLGVAEPVVILEDQAGFVERNEGFIMPVASQTLGQITSDFYESPFSYSIALPIQPQGTLRDVDQDGEEDSGVQIFAIAYWTNTFGDPFLEERDLSGGGWSTAYASTRVSEDANTKREIVGGHFLIYADDDQQGFPSGFGADGLLFTEDDPIVSIPQGYTVVDMDSDPFTFDRSREQAIDLIEPEGAALVDLSGESYSDAFNQLVDKLAKEYAFTENKGLDWEALRAEFAPRIEEAEAAGNDLGYKRALRDFAWSIPDGHVSGPTVIEDFSLQTSGGIGMAIRDLDDGRVIVNYLLEGAPATEAGIELKAEILSINDVPINDAINNAVAHSAPFSTEHFRRLQKLRYAIRFPVDSEVQVAFKNPGSDETQSATLLTVPERESFTFSSFNVGLTGFELPVEYELLEESGYGYVKLYSFSDNSLLTIQLWERMIRSMNQNGVKGLIVDMRQNGGGSGFLADQMAAYFFDEALTLGNTGYYNEGLDDFYFDSRTEDRFYLPAEELRYNGAVAILVGPNCASACEFFSYDMSLNDRVSIVGQYPTAGLGGSIDRVLMPDAEFFTFTQGRAVDGNGEIHIEGKGVPPNVVVPVNEETLFSEGDPILEAGISHLDEATAIELIDGGPLTIGESKSGELNTGQRVRYSLTVAEGDKVSIFLEDPNGELDTVLSLYDEGDNLLLSNDDMADNTLNSALEELEIPRDMGLVVEIASVNDIGEGLYTLNIVDPEQIK